MTVMCNYEPNNVLVDLIAKFAEAKASLGKITVEHNKLTAGFIAAKPKTPICIRYVGARLTKGDIRFEYLERESKRCSGEDVEWLTAEYWQIMKDPERARIAAEYAADLKRLRTKFRDEALSDASDQACDELCNIENSIFNFDPKSVADVRLMLEFINTNIDEGGEETMPDSNLPDGFEFTLIDWLQRFLPPAKH